MSPELFSVAGITTIVVLIFTVFFQYFPGLRLWWAGLAAEVKKLAVLGLYLASGAVVAFGGCIVGLKAVIPALLCSQASPFLSFVFGVLIAVGAGQGVFGILPELNDVKAVKEMRPE
jgi:hypothetical protein